MSCPKEKVENIEGKGEKMKVIDITPQLQKKEKKRLAAYCRVSSDSEDQIHSFAAQIRRYSTYAKEHPEYELVDVYADEEIIYGEQ